MTHTVFFWLRSDLAADDRTAFEAGLRSSVDDSRGEPGGDRPTGGHAEAAR